MAIDFPTSPTNGQTFLSGGIAYTYDGTKWTATASGGSMLGQGNTSAEVIDTGGDGRFVVTTEGIEALRVNASQRLLVGTPANISSLASMIQSASAATSNAFEAARFTASSFGPRFTFCKSRGASVGANALVADGDEIGSIYFNAANGSTYTNAARIEARVDGVPDGSFVDMPGRLVFLTCADGSGIPTERMRISHNGVITIQNGAAAVIGTLTDGAVITPDFAADCNFTVTLGGSRTMADPINITAGQSGSIFIVQDATGSRLLSWGSYWDFPGGTAPLLSTTANAIDRVDYICRNSTSIHAVFTANYS